MSMKEFVARRGRSEKIYSDNFSSCVAADKWIRKVAKEEKVHDFLAKQSVRWQFDLSRAPWWGCQFERMVGLVKQTIFKVMGKSTLRWKELKSLLLDVETTINNRPLRYVEDDIQSGVLPPNLIMFEQDVHIPDREEIVKERVLARWRNLRERHDLRNQSKK